MFYLNNIIFVMLITQIDITTPDKFARIYEQFKLNSQIGQVYYVALKCVHFTQSNSHEILSIQLLNSFDCINVYVKNFHKNLPHSLEEILTSGNWIKTGFMIDECIKHISNYFNIGQCNGCVDLQKYCLLTGTKNYNVESIFEIYDLGKKYLKQSSSVFTKRNIFVNNNSSNYVGLLQEHIIKNNTNKNLLPKYTSYEVDKKTHLFAVECKFKQFSGYGIGRKKIIAKQHAAKDLYLKLNDSFTSG